MMASYSYDDNTATWLRDVAMKALGGTREGLKAYGQNCLNASVVQNKYHLTNVYPCEPQNSSSSSSTSTLFAKYKQIHNRYMQN